MRRRCTEATQGSFNARICLPGALLALGMWLAIADRLSPRPVHSSLDANRFVAAELGWSYAGVTLAEAALDGAVLAEEEAPA